jgi:hypothetical protein
VNPEANADGDHADAATSEPAIRPMPTGATPPPAIAGETANGSVPRVGRRYPRDYEPLMAQPFPPQGTAAAAGGRPEHALPDGGTGLGHQAPPGWPDYRRG